MQYKYIILEKGTISKIILNRPPLNILNIEMMNEINLALEELQKENTKCIAISSLVKSFSVGVDIKEHIAEKVNEMIEVFHRIFYNLQKIEVPTVAVVNGSALGGGCELAISCDIVLASDKSTFGQPEIKVGVFPPIACVKFPRLIGRNKTIELLLNGEVISSENAKEIGLINQVFPSENFEEEVKKFLEKLTSNSLVVLKLTKKAIHSSLELNYANGVKNVEEIYLNKLMKTEDANEGLNAFIEKRKPIWRER